MLRYIIKRILWLIPVIICVSFIVFSLMELTPGTFLDSINTNNMTQEEIAELRSLYDLDKSLIYRYGKYMFGLIQGDLGVSDYSGNDVWKTYLSRLPNTLILSLAALIIGLVFSIPLGILAARKAGTIADTGTTTFTLIGISMPGFWLGLLLLYFFSYKLRWLPAGGYSMGIRSLVLPAVCSGLLLMASSARQTRSSMLEVLSADYLRTARAKGAPERAVIMSDALGNAWVPILTTIGASICVTLAGSVVTESVFTWPGVGRLTVEAVLTRDVKMTCGCVIMTTILYVLVQLLVDIAYAYVDPRIRAQYSSTGRKKERTNPELVSNVVHRTEGAPAALPKLRRAVLGLNSEWAQPKPVPDDLDISDESTDSICINNANYPMPYAEQDGGTGTARTDEADILVTKKYRKRSQMGEIFHSLVRNKSALAGLVIFIFLILVLIGSLFISFDAVTNTSTNRLNSPSWRFLFGTDMLGRDMFLRTIYGARYSLLIGFAAVAISSFFGILFGSIAGYYGKLTDDLIMRASDILASIPSLLLGMVIVTVLGQSIPNLIFAVGVTGIPVFTRITRSSILIVKSNEFVDAARAIGLSNPRIIFTHVLQNGLAPIIVTFSGSIGLSIIVAASLSFLGFGVPLPYPEWGVLVSSGREFINNASHIMTFPGLFIMITVLAFNLLGDGLRDALDPKLKRR